jgi:NSS family neurotransmitter:Na+ symporter
MQKQREHWSSHLGFILVAAGSAIGLGILWKFPYVTGENGGGLFFLVYIACTLLIGIPVFIGELVIGRRAQRGAVGAFAHLSHNNTFWKSVGWLGVLSSFFIMSYYSVLAGWGMNYVLMSLSHFWKGKSLEEIRDTFDVLASAGDITLFWHFAFTALTVAVVYPGIRHGIEYWSRFMTSGLFIILVGLTAYSLTLPGMVEGVKFFLQPDFSKLTAAGILQALGLSFFTLSLGQGIMITYGSYMRPHDDIPKTGLIVGSMTIVIAFMMGLMIFPIIFTFNFPPAAGPGLVFKTLPVLFSQLPGSLLISTVFFILFVFTALTSAIALVEVVVANFIDLFGWTRKKAALIVGAACFLFGIPSALSVSGPLFSKWNSIYGKTFFTTIDDLTTDWLLPVTGFLTALYIGWFLERDKAFEEYSAGSSMNYLFKPWLFFMRWVAPTAVFLIILNKSGVIQIDHLFDNFKGMFETEGQT